MPKGIIISIGKVLVKRFNMENRVFSQLNLYKRISCGLSVGIMLLVIAFCSFSFASPVLAQDTTNNQKMMQNAKDEVLRLDKEYKFLKEQTKEFRRFIETERKQHQEFLQWSIYVVSIIIVVVSVIFGLFGLKTINDAKKGIGRSVKEKFDEYIDENTEKIKITVNDIAEKVIQEKLNLKKSICFLVPGSLQKNVEDNEVDMLRRRGFENIELKPIEESIDDKYDLVIFHYQEVQQYQEAQQENLTKLVSSLEENPKPLIVYFPGEGRVNKEAFEKYKWHVLANTPLTLVSWVFTTLNSFKSMKK